MRGRPPKAPTLRLIKGTSRAGAKVATPRPRGALSEAPAFLSPSQQSLWHYHVAAAAPGTLRATDGGILSVFVVAVDLARQARELIGNDLVVESITGAMRPHPALAIMNAQTSIALRAGTELGFSPASRARVTAVPDDAPDEFFPAG